MKQSFFRTFSYLFIRAIKQAIRPLIAILPSFFMPLFFFIVYSYAFTNISNLPGFGGSSYLAFYSPVALLMAVFFTSGDAGFELMLDITSGYFEKLLLAPIPRLAILLPRIVAMGLRALAQSIVMLILLFLFGAPLKGGIVGILLIFGLVIIFGMGWSGIGLTLAALTKNPRVLQTSFIFTFPLTFITTAQLPKELLTGWYKVAVTINPLTYILEGVRGIMTQGVDWHQVAVSYLVAFLILVVTSASSIWAFKRMVR
ncbi:MAG: ABC transporter permease [Candidatus Berkelbacteria bacterium]|nr:ABC transporter permease [Candidatus Berkelbacteria bacterium]